MFRNLNSRWQIANIQSVLTSLRLDSWRKAACLTFLLHLDMLSGALQEIRLQLDDLECSLLQVTGFFVFLDLTYTDLLFEI